ncbi:MAG: hypothetical protein WEA75_07575 [Acidimicrobiia bacterium]
MPPDLEGSSLGSNASDSREPSIRPDGTPDFSGIGRMSRYPAISLSSKSDLDEVNNLLAQAGLPAAKLEKADFSRGASGPWGTVLEVVVAIDLAGGAVATIVGTAKVLRKIHQRLSKKRGTAATISLGTAEYFAAADLIDRIKPDDIKVLNSGDIRRGAADSSFIGGDAYWIVFEAGDCLHHYHVDSYGRVTYVGDAPHAPDHTERPPPAPEE